MIKKIKLSQSDISLFNRIANSFPNTAIQIAQDNITISAKSSYLGYSILDFEKEMTLIVYDDDTGGIIQSFQQWFI